MFHSTTGTLWPKLGLMIALVAALPGSLTAQDYLVADIGSDNGMLRMYTGEAERADFAFYEKSDDGAWPLRMSFYLENVSGASITSALISAYVYTATGAAKGFYTFTLEERLQPGDIAYFVRKTSAFEVAESDRVILVLEEIEGVNRTWKIPEQALDELDWSSTLSELESNADFMGLKLQQKDACIAFCDAREAKCNSTCACGVLEFGCSCGSDGTRSSSCKCQICRE